MTRKQFVADVQLLLARIERADGPSPSDAELGDFRCKVDEYITCLLLIRQREREIDDTSRRVGAIVRPK